MNSALNWWLIEILVVNILLGPWRLQSLPTTLPDSKALHSFKNKSWHRNTQIYLLNGTCEIKVVISVTFGRLGLMYNIYDFLKKIKKRLSSDVNEGFVQPRKEKSLDCS